MNNYFYLKWYIYRWDANIAGLSDAELGGYMRLAKFQHENKGFTEEQAKGIFGKRFARYWPKLRPRFKKIDNVYFIDWELDSMIEREILSKKMANNPRGIKTVIAESEVLIDFVDFVNDL